VNACRPWLAPLLIAAAAGPVLADPLGASFLVPSRYTTAQTEAITVRFGSGAGFDTTPDPWPSDRVEWMLVRGGPTQENRHDVRPAKAADDFVTVEIAHPGVTLIGVDQKPDVIDVTGAELKAFAAAHLGETAARARIARLGDDQKVRVRRVASAKTLIRVADGAITRPSATALGKTGQVVELRPLIDPTVVAPGTDLPLWVYVGGVKRPGVKVEATHVASGKQVSFETGRGGAGHVRIPAAGVWRVAAYFIEPAGDAAATWVLRSATLTFETKGAGR
jgi:hypothetical protein